MKQKRYLLPPCPSWDMEGTESWLQDMALEGWQLDKNGFFFGLATFEEATPQRLRYRLEATSYKRNLWDDNMGEPDGEQRQLCEELGWRYVCPRGQFFVYVSEDPAAPELHTDPEVQALNIKKLKQRQRDNAFHFLFWLCIYPLLRVSGSLLSLALVAGLGLSLCFLLLIPLELSRELWGILSLRKLQKRLERGEEADHHKDWRKGKWLHWSGSALSLLLTVLTLWGVGSVWYSDSMKLHQQDLKTYEEPLPFPTMEAFAEGDFIYEDLGSWANTITVDGNFLAPTIIHLNQNGRMEKDGVTVLDGGFEVTYLDCRFDWMAEQYGKEALRHYARSPFRDELTYLELPELDVDYAVAFRDIFPTIILAKDGKVLELEFYQTGSHSKLEIGEIARVMAEGL